MRALRVLGLAEDGAQLLCEEPDSGDLFAVPTDDRLRTVLRGVVDIPTAPSIQASGRTPTRETTVEPQLRPRDIQQRIRAGASLAEVAADAGVDESRIEKFAYPVLMERGSMADRSRTARTMVGGAPSSHTVEELAMRTLSDRGQAASASWDAYREESGNWILTLTWFAGHTDNVAHWSIHTGGSTVSPLDDAASSLLDPAPRPLRRVPENIAEPTPDVPLHPMVLRDDEQRAAVHPSAPAGDPEVAAKAPAAPQISGNAVAAALATHAVRPAETPTEASAAAPRRPARTGTDDARETPGGGSRSGKKPSMPSWEDVLLGVRSSGR